MFGLERRQQIIIFVILGALLFGGGIKYAKNLMTSPKSELVLENEQKGIASTNDPAEPTSIYVHVIGAVQKPGIYQLPAKSRVFEAIEKAIPLPEAEIQSLNLAKLLRDEEKVIVPRLEEAVEIGSNTASGITKTDNKTGVVGKTSSLLSPQATSGNGKVNINSALAEELDARLPGVGPTLAQRIIEFREQNGDFRSIEDIQNVSGIGEKRFAQIKDYITINY